MFEKCLALCKCSLLSSSSPSSLSLVSKDMTQRRPESKDRCVIVPVGKHFAANTGSPWDGCEAVL